MAVNALSTVPGFWTIAGHLNADINPDPKVTPGVALQDFVADVKGIGRPFAWVGSQVSGLLPRPTTDQVMLPEGTEEAPMDLDAGVEQAGAAIAGAQQAGQQAIQAAAETLEGKQKESQNAGAEPVEKNN